MNPVQFTGLNTNQTVNSSNDNKKRTIKRVAVGAAIVGTAVAGGAFVYKNRNSKQVQKAVTVVKENVLNPINKKARFLKEKATLAYESLKSKLVDLKNKSSENNVIEQAKQPDAVKKPAKAKKPAKTAKSVQVARDAKNKIVQTAKDNAEKLRTGAAGLGAGAVVGAAGVGAVNKVNEISNDGLEKGKKIILTSDGEEFKGYFKLGKAYNEDGTPLNDKLTYVYSAGTKVITGVDSEDQMVVSDKRDIRKTIMTYKDGVLRQATHFSDIDTKIPTFIKHYDANGKVVNMGEEFSYAGEKGKVIPAVVADYTVHKNPNLINSPLLAKKRIVEKDGTVVYKYFKKNLDEDGAIKGKPVYVFSTKTKTLEDGSVQTDFYAPDSQWGEESPDFLVKTTVKRPDGITKISMMSRNFGVCDYGKTAISGPVKSVLTLDKNGRAVSYKLPLEADHSLDGLIRLRGGKILSVNDESHYTNLGYPMGDAVKWAPLKFGFPDKEDKFSDEIYTSHDLTSKIGIKYYEDGQTVKSIATYHDFSDFPDIITYFDKDGRPVQDVGYKGRGEETIFCPKYVFNEPLPTLSDDIQAARAGILRFETRVHAKATHEAREALKTGSAKQGIEGESEKTYTSA